MQPPQNPYENPNFPSPGQPLGTGSGLARGPVISFDTIGEAWKLLQPNLGLWIGASLIYALPTLIISVLQNLALSRDSQGIPHIGPLYWVFTLLSFFVAQFLIGGLFRMAIHNVRTGRAELGLMFSAGDVYLSLLGAGLLTGLALVVGFLLCFVPGLLLSGLLLLVTPLVVDKRLGAVEAMSTSFNALKPQIWMALLYAFVIGLVAYAGALACGVGLLVTAPLALLSLAITYRDFFDSGSRPTAMPNFPVAPIADPGH